MDLIPTLRYAKCLKRRLPGCGQSAAQCNWQLLYAEGTELLCTQSLAKSKVNNKHGVESVTVWCKSLLHIAATEDKVINQCVCLRFMHTVIWFV